MNVGATGTVAPPAATAVIDSFTAEHRFLSNYHETTVRWLGEDAPTAEHHFAAAKTKDDGERSRILAAPTPGAAKRLGRAVDLRQGWDYERFAAMRSIVAAKFTDPGLRDRLLATGDALLIEGTTWHDNVWGDDTTCGRASCREPGQNHLGRILMAERARARGDGPGRWPRVAITGHRPQAFSAEEARWVRSTLRDVVERLRDEHDTKVIIHGACVGTDQWMAQTAHAAGLATWAYLPFEQQSQRWAEADQITWRWLRAAAHRTVCLGDGYDGAKYLWRNALLVRDSDLVVSVHHPEVSSGGTVWTIRHARREGRPMLRVNPFARTVTYVAPR